MNLDLTVFNLAGVGILLVTLAGGLIGLLAKNRVPGLGFRDGVRAVVYLTRYDAALEYQGLGRRELRARVDELRANLVESAADAGGARAIQRLGPPRVLAAEVAGARMVPSWLRGTIWLAAAVAIGVFAVVLSTSAFLSALESAASTGATASWSTSFLTMSATSGQGGPSTFTVGTSLLTPLVLLVPFGLGARVWRLWTGKRTPRASALRAAQDDGGSR